MPPCQAHISPYDCCDKLLQTNPQFQRPEISFPSRCRQNYAPSRSHSSPLLALGGCWNFLACGHITLIFKASIFKCLCCMPLCVDAPPPASHKDGYDGI